MRLKRNLDWIFRPLSIFVVAQISWGLLMFVWIRWYVLRSREFDAFLQVLPLEKNYRNVSTVILVQGCILMGVILIGLYLIFVNFRRQVALNKMQSSILDNVTHELKTPLATIRLYTETLLLRDLAVEARKSFLEKNMREIERLQKLIDGILVSARIDAGYAKIDKEPSDILWVIGESWKKMTERIGDKRAFSYEKYGDAVSGPCYVSMYVPQMEVLFNNLFDNAVKYSPRGGTISLKVYATAEKVHISVSDNGYGIERKELKSIFKKFFRSNDSHKKGIPGSGLGLFVCHSIVSEHRGKLSAVSDGLNKGATFHVEFKRISSTY